MAIALLSVGIATIILFLVFVLVCYKQRGIDEDFTYIAMGMFILSHLTLCVLAIVNYFVSG
jgi:hypothetical protein